MNTRTVLLWHDNGVERIYFTVNPARLSVSRPNRNRVAALAMGGSVNIWAGRGLREVKFETFLPAPSSPFFSGEDPESIIALLKRWQDSGDPVRLILSDSDVNDAFLIEDVTEVFREGDRDVGLSLSLREYKFKSALAALAGGWGGAPLREDGRPAQASYVVKKGDTLWDVACRFYGDGTRWGELAERNGVADPRKLQVGKVLAL